MARKPKKNGTIRFHFAVSSINVPKRDQLIGPIALVRAFDRAAKPKKRHVPKLRPVRDPKATGGKGPWKAWAAR